MQGRADKEGKVNPFTKALEVLDERGWTQRTLEDADGRLCARGAVAAAYGWEASEWGREPYRFDWTLVTKAERFLVEQGLVTPHNRGDSTALTRFNDSSSEEDVRLLLKHAAAAWDEGQR
jgi:hypothetical protein